MRMAGWMCAGRGIPCPTRVFDKDQRVTHAAITENKRLGDVLAYIKERQDQQANARGEDQQREDWLHASGAASRAGGRIS